MLALLLPGVQVLAQEVPPEELYLTQAGSRTCTLCSATMMLRSCMYKLGDDRWQQVTEDSVAVSAWTSEGMYWNWSYSIGDNNVNVAQQGCSGITEENLRDVLDEHPEGIVLYCGGSAPHAVFLSDYEDDVFYCADPAMGYAEKRITLAESLLGDRHGGQAQILSAVSAYWYVSSHNIEDQSYLAGCKEYPTDCRIRVRWDGDAVSLPCPEGQEDSQKVFRIHSGDHFKASAFLINRDGQYWYRVGEDVYISAIDARCVPAEEQPLPDIRPETDIQENTDVVLLLLEPEIPPKNTK